MPRIVIAAFDGLQPSQITAERMPVVDKIATEGVRFLHNHAVFPTVTRANSASLVTGVTPGKHGLTANKTVFPDYSSTEVVDALVPKLSEINRLTDGGLLFVPTLGELISEKQLRWVSVVGGTSGNAYVQHPNAPDFGGVVIHPEFTNPAHHHLSILQTFGEWPAKEALAAELVKRTADVAIDYAVGELEPDVLLVWFPEPDTSQHAFGIDSPEAQKMYSLADEQLGRILGAIEERGDSPDVFVVSDHGYSTIDSVVDIHAELNKDGFGLDRADSSVIVAENGGSALLYLPEKDSDEQVARDLLGWLSAQAWVGAIATDLAVSGTTTTRFGSINDVGLDGPRSPDIAITLRSADTGQPAPLARSGTATGGEVGLGSHGGGSPAELHNTLIVSGPSFRSGARSELPSGNIDIAPTILALLDISPPSHFDGRILDEALRDGGPDSRAELSSNRSNSSPVLLTKYDEAEYLCEFG